MAGWGETELAASTNLTRQLMLMNQPEQDINSICKPLHINNTWEQKQAWIGGTKATLALGNLYSDDTGGLH